ncbi:hypothetical protein [Rossellomorea marisflavi]|nr:hypothetical protein [Rossellomorea marisflavi]
MNQEKLLEQLKLEIEALSEGNEVKASLEKVEEILNNLYLKK